MALVAQIVLVADHCKGELKGRDYGHNLKERNAAEHVRCEPRLLVIKKLIVRAGLKHGHFQRKQ